MSKGGYGLRMLASLGVVSSLVGCGQPPAPEIDPLWHETKAELTLPKPVQAGPYKLEFLKEGASAAFIWRNIPGELKQISLTLPAAVTGPKVKSGDVWLRVDSPDEDGKPSGAYGDQPVKTPSIRTGITITNPRNPRPDKIDVRGVVEEVVVASYTVHLKTLVIERDEGDTSPNHSLRTYKVSAPVEEVSELADGVTVKVVRRPENSNYLPLQISWDSKRVLPKLPSEQATISDLRSNIGRVDSTSTSDGGSRGTADALQIADDGTSEAHPKELVLHFNLVKRTRRYPFSATAKLKWPPAPSKKEGAGRP